MKIFVTLMLAVILPSGILGQLGIKTRHPIPSSGNLVVNVTSVNSNYSREIESYYPHMSVRPIRPYVFVDKTAQFLNETRSKMSSGVCFKEVATASLVPNPSDVPAGNGSDPSLSRIQICCDGYERNVHNFKQCDPICTRGCVNGMCVAPDTCVCYPDHVRNLAGYCLTTCPIGCGNGECQPDRSCACKPGYVLEPEKKFCVPFCTKGCLHGNCTAPDTCECVSGYSMNPDGYCEPKCDNCENGRCTSPGVCVCHTGYLRRDHRCEPVCSKSCNNGFCSAPEVCACKPGFELDRSGINCVAHCDVPCLNGYCNGNNVCSCNTGYIQDEFQPNICNPHCPQGCPNGYCTSPNFCVCKPGYIKSGVKGRQQCTALQ